MLTWNRISGLLVFLVAMIAIGGCEPPPSVPSVPPGDDLRQSLMPEEEPAVARGEQGAQAKPQPTADLVPALPTEKGETKTTASGVVYETIKPGTGETAKAGQTVTVHYVGTLDDGRKFDSSRDRPAPFTTSIGTTAVIKGWDEAIPGMKIGEIRKMTIPPSAGYGALGQKDTIPPNATLHFEVELLKVE